MIVYTVTSFMAIVFVCLNVLVIETHIGFCATDIVASLLSAPLVGAVGSFIALRQIIHIWQSPGVVASISRIIHLTLLVGFTLFVFRNYTGLDFKIVCAFAGVIAIGSAVALIKDCKRNKVPNKSECENH